MPSDHSVTCPCRLLVMAAAVIAISIIVPNAAGQDTAAGSQQPQSAPQSSRPFSMKGELGTFGELYGMSGREARRPGSTGRIFLRSTVSAWNSVSATFNLLLSNEGSSARQDINQLDFNPRWRWGEAHLGDFSGELSPLTMSGIRVRGGGLMLSPGKVRLTLISGRTARSVASETSSRSYERSITGVKIGYGGAEGSSFDLNVCNARDRLNSIADVVVDTTTVDSSMADFEQNPVSVTPQENLVVSAATNLVFMQRKLKWRSEVAGSAITRDRRSAELDNSGVPGFLKDLFKPRKSSGADFAYTSDMNLDFRKLSFSAGFHYLGPGYVSLGLASLMSDKQEITAGTVWRFTGGQVRLDGAVQHDNLIHQKNYTTNRTRVNSVLAYRLRPDWNATVGATFVGMANDSPSDTTRMDYSSWILRTGQYFTFRRQVGLRSVSGDYTYQKASDKNLLRRSSGTNSHSVTLTALYGVNSSIDVAPTVGLISARVGDGSTMLTQTYTLSARHAAVQRRLASSATMTVSVADVTTTLRPNLRSNFEFGGNYSLTAEIESTFVRGGSESSRFNEVAGRLIFTRRF
jgi:hypothetical protein